MSYHEGGRGGGVNTNSFSPVSPCLLSIAWLCRNSGLEVQIKEKLLSAEREVGRLHNLEQRLNSKLHQRRQKTKLTVF